MKRRQPPIDGTDEAVTRPGRGHPAKGGRAIRHKTRGKPTYCGIIMVPTHRHSVPDIRLETVHADTPD